MKMDSDKEVTRIISSSSKRGKTAVQAIVNGTTKHLRVLREIGKPVLQTVLVDSLGREYGFEGKI